MAGYRGFRGYTSGLIAAVVGAAALTVAGQVSAAPSKADAARKPARTGASATPAASAAAAATPTAAAAATFRVEKFTPLGPATTMDTLTVEFSSDLPAELSDPQLAAARGLLAVDPNVEGVLRVESPRKVRFTPRFGLRPATRYTARINPALRDTAGRALTGESAFKFNTPPLSLTEVKQTGFSGDRRATIELTFSDAVLPADLKRLLKLSEGDRPLGFFTIGEARGATVRVKTDRVSGDKIRVTVEPGLTGAKGPLGLPAAVERTVELGFSLKVNSVTANWDDEKVKLRLAVSNSVDPVSAKASIRVEPETAFEVEDEYEAVILKGDFKANTRYTVKVRKGLLGTNGESLAKDASLAIWVPAMKPFVRLPDEGGHLSTKGRMKLRVRTAGVTSFTVEAVRVYDSNLAPFVVFGRGANSGEYDFNRFGKALPPYEVNVATTDLRKPAVTEVDLRAALGADASGMYRVSVKARPDASAVDPDNAPAAGSWSRGRYMPGEPNLSADGVIAVSDLGLVAKRAPESLTVWAAGLADAKPAAGVKVQAFNGKNQPLKEGVTGADGMVTLRGLSDDPEGRPAVIVASGPGAKADNLCYLDLRKTLSGGEETPTGGRDYLGDGYECFLTPDRGAYRPGETAHLLGLIRGRDGAPPPAALPVELALVRPDGKTLPARRVMASATGSFTIDLPLSAGSPTGLHTAYVFLAGGEAAAKKAGARRASESSDYDEESDSSSYEGDGGGDGDGSAGRGAKPNATRRPSDRLGEAEFFVEDFLPNRLKVTATAAERRFAPGDDISVAVKAEEMFGQAAAGRPAEALATFRAIAFEPEAWKGWTFGDTDRKFERTEVKAEEATTDESGRATFALKSPVAVKAPSALRASVQAIVKDQSGRGVTASFERQVDPVPYYLGLRAKGDTFPKPGEAGTFDIAGVKPDGTTLPDDAELTVAVYRVRYNSVLTWKDGGARWTTSRELKPLLEQTLSLGGGRAALAFTPPGSGAYLLRASDPKTGAISAMPFYASNGRWDDQPWSLEKPERLEITPDHPKTPYAPGDTARLLVKSPFPGTLLLTLEQDGVLTASTHLMDRNTLEVAVPIEATHAPNVYVAATVLRAVKPTDKWLPHRALGLTNLSVSPAAARRISVELDAPAEVKPSSKLTVKATLRDAATSAPTSGEVTLWAVDEGVLDLTAFKTPDPLAFFFSPRRLMVETADFLGDLMPELLPPAAAASAPGGGDGAGANARRSPVAADRVKPVALWLGTLKAKADGTAAGEFALPRFFGRLRLMAVAADGARFGGGERAVFVRGPLLVRDNLPRFAAPGDRFYPTYTMFNNAASTVTVKLTVSADGPVAPVPTGKFAATGRPGEIAIDTEIAGGGQHTRGAEFKAAPGRAGVSRTTFEGVAGGESFSGEVELPVRPASPATRESVTLRGREGQLIEMASNTAWMPGTTTGALSVGASPAIALLPALDELSAYPYGCAEQTVSGAFPALALADLLSDAEPTRYSKDAITARVQAAVDRLFTMQTADGGLALWPGERDADDWATLYGAHFLVEARKAGYETPEASMALLLDQVSTRLSMGVTGETVAADAPAAADGAAAGTGASTAAKPDSAAWTRRAYAGYTLARAGRAGRDALEPLVEAKATLPVEAKALLGLALRAAGRPAAEVTDLLPDGLAPGAAKGADAAAATGGILASPARTLSLLLLAHLETDPKSAVVDKLAAALRELSSNRGGRWGSTQENAFAILALGRLAKARAGETPPAGTVEFADGRSLPFGPGKTASVAEAGLAGTSVTLKVTAGDPYVAWSVEGVPLTPPAKVEDGIRITRRLTDRAGKTLPASKAGVDGTRLPQGRLVVVELTLANLTPRAIDNVAVEDLLPAGLEIENPNLATSEKTNGGEGEGEGASEGEGDASESGKNKGTTPAKVRRVENRDDRLVAFLDLPGPAEAGATAKPVTLRYAARAITLGTYVHPPAQARAMYAPDVVGRTATGTFIVTPKDGK